MYKLANISSFESLQNQANSSFSSDVSVFNLLHPDKPMDNALLTGDYETLLRLIKKKNEDLWWCLDQLPLSDLQGVIKSELIKDKRQKKKLAKIYDWFTEFNTFETLARLQKKVRQSQYGRTGGNRRHVALYYDRANPQRFLEPGSKAHFYARLVGLDD